MPQTRDTHFKHLEKLKAEHASQQREYERFEAREGLRKCIEQLQAKVRLCAASLLESSVNYVLRRE